MNHFEVDKLIRKPIEKYVSCLHRTSWTNVDLTTILFFRLTQQIADYCFAKPPLIFHMIRAAFGSNLWFDFMQMMANKYAFGHAGLDEWAEVLDAVTMDKRAGKWLTGIITVVYQFTLFTCDFH